uniref:Uncharacterized protein n=1 Tax=Bubo bubo TaxID=30461 RepID=A0A8C0EGF8_BUBBB
MAQTLQGHGHSESLGAGKAIAVLTSGGDAQGKGHPGDPKSCYSRGFLWVG